MISIDRQPWAHSGDPAFVTLKSNPIADPRRSLMNWPCSPSFFNWWRVPFQVDHHYVPRVHRFSAAPPNLFNRSFFFPASFKEETSVTSTCLWAAAVMSVQWPFVSTEAYWVHLLKSMMRSERKVKSRLTFLWEEMEPRGVLKHTFTHTGPQKSSQMYMVVKTVTDAH